MEVILFAVILGCIGVMVSTFVLMAFLVFVYLPVISVIDRVSPRLRARIEYFLIYGC